MLWEREESEVTPWFFCSGPWVDDRKIDWRAAMKEGANEIEGKGDKHVCAVTLWKF